VDQHLRYHWDLPTGVKKIITVLEWEERDFKLELAICMGTCPDHGSTATRKDSQNSPLAVLYPDKGSAALKPGQWFAHVQQMNSTKVPGKDCKFKVFG